MNRFTLGSMALASALLAPAASYAEVSCTREVLKAASDLSVAARRPEAQAGRARDELRGELRYGHP